MKLIIGIIVKAVLNWFAGRRDYAKKIKLKIKNKQLEKENDILSKQSSNTITTINRADQLFKRLSKRKK